jgi:hypothetical protein
MKISSALLLAFTLVVGSMLPASAVQVRIPVIHKVVTVDAAVTKPAHYRLINIANAQQFASAGSGDGCSVPLVLGIAY